MTHRITLPALAVLLLAAAAPGAGLQQKLDRPVSLDLRNRPVEEVFARLAQATGADLRIAPDTLACLPYGSQTELSVTLKDVTLRKALPAMLRPHGLDWQIDGENLLIVPSDALYRTGRRATFEELQRLGKLLSSPLRQPADDLRQSLRDATGLADLTVRLVEIPRAQIEAARTTAASILPATAGEYLDALCDAVRLSWYLDGRTVVLLPRQKQLQRQLQRKVSLRYQNAPLAQVLLDLARKARIRLSLTPGLLKMLPSDVRTNYTLIMADATIAQALEVISGNTGVEFDLGNDGLHAKPSVYLEVQSGSAGQSVSRGVFLETSLQTSSGQTVKIYILPDQLPPDLRNALQQQRQTLIDDLRRHYGTTENPSP